MRAIDYYLYVGGTSFYLDVSIQEGCWNLYPIDSHWGIQTYTETIAYALGIL